MCALIAYGPSPTEREQSFRESAVWFCPTLAVLAYSFIVVVAQVGFSAWSSTESNGLKAERVRKGKKEKLHNQTRIQKKQNPQQLIPLDRRLLKRAFTLTDRKRKRLGNKTL